MVIFEKADLFYLINESIERHKTCFSEFFEIPKKFNDMVIFEKADLFYLMNESIERHKTSFSEFF